MSLLGGFRSAQKLRRFLAVVFPTLAWERRTGAVLVDWLDRHPRLAANWRRVRGSPLGVSVERVVSAFITGEGSRQPLDWSIVSRDSAAVLRTAILAAGSLCLLLPVAVTWAWPPLSAEAITGAPGSAIAGWSAALWLVAFAFGFACLLAGSGSANRVAFAPSLAVFLYFGAATVGALPKSWWSLLLPLQGALALVASESRLGGSGRRGADYGLASSLLSGAMIACIAVIVVPTAPWFRGRLLAVSLALGAPLGAALWAVAGRLRGRAARRAPGASAVRLDVAVGVLTAMSLLLLLSLAVRGGLTTPAGSILSFSIQVTGYLWPLYYFLGTGVVFKVLRQTRAVHGLVHDLAPAWLLVPTSLLLLALANAVTWIEPILLRPGFPWPSWMLAAADWIYHASSWLWASSLARSTMEPMKWAYLAAASAAVWALLCRRLTRRNMADLLFGLILLTLAVLEYHVELAGFARSPARSAIGLFLFTILILWMVHTTLSKILTGSSAGWPQPARTAMYGAGLMFVLLPIHARAAAHSSLLTSELVLYLFLGVINFGVPYALYLYASRQLSRVPMSAAAALGLFCLGGAGATLLVILDKVVVAGSVSGAWAIAVAQADGVLRGQPAATQQPFFETWWVVVRGLLAIGGVLAVGSAVRRRFRVAPAAPAAAMLAVIAVAAGLACFSNRSLELPLLPHGFLLLITPIRESPIVDAGLVARQLSLLIPALLLGLALSSQRSNGVRLLELAGAFLSHIVIGLIWPAGEAWLRSTGAMLGATGVSLVLLWLLAGLFRDRLTQMLGSAQLGDDGAALGRRLLTRSQLGAGQIALLALFVAAAAWCGATGRLGPHPVSGGQFIVRLPSAWTAPATGEGAEPATLTRRSWSEFSPLLWVETRPCLDDSLGELLQEVVLETSRRLADYHPLGVERWDHLHPGAIALSFSYNRSAGDPGTGAIGTTALVPLPAHEVLVATVVHSTTEVARRWDLARAVQAVRR